MPLHLAGPGGASVAFHESMTSLLFALSASSLAYMILAASQFNSFSHPITVFLDLAAVGGGMGALPPPQEPTFQHDRALFHGDRKRTRSSWSIREPAAETARPGRSDAERDRSGCARSSRPDCDPDGGDPARARLRRDRIRAPMAIADACCSDRDQPGRGAGVLSFARSGGRLRAYRAGSAIAGTPPSQGAEQHPLIAEIPRDTSDRGAAGSGGGETVGRQR